MGPIFPPNESWMFKEAIKRCPTALLWAASREITSREPLVMSTIKIMRTSKLYYLWLWEQPCILYVSGCRLVDFHEVFSSIPTCIVLWMWNIEKQALIYTERTRTSVMRELNDGNIVQNFQLLHHGVISSFVPLSPFSFWPGLLTCSPGSSNLTSALVPTKCVWCKWTCAGLKG